MDYIQILPSGYKTKATMDFIKKHDDKRFQYAVTVALNHKEIVKKSERISKI